MYSLEISLSAQLRIVLYNLELEYIQIMAKNKKKTKPKAGGGAKATVENSDTEDEGSVYNDGASVTSEASTVIGDAEDSVDESSQIEQFEGKIKDAIELASQKSAAGRVKALDALCSGFVKRYCPDFVENQQMTICDLIERSLKKGKGAEIEVAARLSILLSLQLQDPEEVYKELKPLMVQNATDKTTSAVARAAVASSLAGLCFLGGGEMAEVVSTMGVLEGIFSGSYTKPDWSLPSLPSDITSLHSTCLAAWSLLLTLQSSGEVYRMANTMVTKLRGLLLSNDVELRITAGEAIALILEFAYDYDEEFELEELESLIASLRELATDSNKSRSKKDRKEQRSSFRDILRGVEEGDPPNEKVKFGQEVLFLDCWYKKIQYEWFCKPLGSGMNLHLNCNYMLREIFEMGAPLPAFDATTSQRPSKTERNAANQLAFKARTVSRNKNRDKRSAVF